MHLNFYYVFYSQFSDQHVSAAIVVIFKVKIGTENCDKIVNKIHHDHWSPVCWLFIYYAHKPIKSSYIHHDVIHVWV